MTTLRLLAEMGVEDEFDRAIAASVEKLAVCAKEALAKHRSGQTCELGPNLNVSPVPVSTSREQTALLDKLAVAPARHPSRHDLR